MSALHFKELQLRNFLSFGNNLTCIDLSDFGTTLIQGQNMDSGGANGAGKCLLANTPINIRIKGVPATITIGELYELARDMETHS